MCPSPFADQGYAGEMKGQPEENRGRLASFIYQTCSCSVDPI
jgi:hypothetical protein